MTSPKQNFESLVESQLNLPSGSVEVISVTVLRDIYITIGDQLDDGSWIVNIQINYLIRWIWLSALLMGLAGVILVFSNRVKT